MGHLEIKDEELSDDRMQEGVCFVIPSFLLPTFFMQTMPTHWVCIARWLADVGNITNAPDSVGEPSSPLTSIPNTSQQSSGYRSIFGDRRTPSPSVSPWAQPSTPLVYPTSPAGFSPSPSPPPAKLGTWFALQVNRSPVKRFVKIGKRARVCEPELPAEHSSSPTPAKTGTSPRLKRFAKLIIKLGKRARVNELGQDKRPQHSSSPPPPAKIGT